MCNTKKSIILPLLISIISFYVVLGFNVLDTSNIAWLGNNWDTSTHYLGWLFYRNTGWNFPIGLSPSYGLDLASSIYYTDSIPLLAIPLKMFSSDLPEVFQYFGIWLFLGFFLQAYIAWLIIGIYTDNNVLKIFSVVMLIFSPPMMYRLHGHLALSSHFIILIAIYLNLRQSNSHRAYYWVATLSIAILVNAYIFLMSLGLWVANILDSYRRDKTLKKKLLIEAFFMVPWILLLAWQAGMFSVGSGVSADGFGFYRFNILSLVDPNEWSYVLGDIKGGDGDYEGFNYLGLGLIICTATALILEVKNRGILKSNINDQFFFLIVLLLFFIFSLSNNIGIGPISFKYWMPDFAVNYANIFRSSGRFFWPIFYLLVLFSLVKIIKNLNYKISITLLFTCMILQIVDTHSGWKSIRAEHLVDSSQTWQLSLKDQFWKAEIKNYNNIVVIPPLNIPPNWRDLAYLSGVNKISTNAIYHARVDSQKLENAKIKADKLLYNGVYDANTLYILDNLSYKTFNENNSQNELSVQKIDGLNVILPKK